MGGAILDFGAGTGLMLRTLGESRLDAELNAIEPFMTHAADSRIRYLNSFEELLGHQVDLITAFEVCEHLTDMELNAFLTCASDHLKPQGHVIISVPIMIGAVLVLKELNHMVLYRKRAEYGLGEFLRNLIGLEIPRPDLRQGTHKGFDFRWLRREINQKFLIEREFYSPLPLPWCFNSQAFFICSKKVP